MRALRNRWLRALLLASVYLLGALGIVATGGGGGGDDEIEDWVTFSILPTISETIRSEFELNVQIHAYYEEEFSVQMSWHNALNGESGSKWLRWFYAPLTTCDPQFPWYCVTDWNHYYAPSPHQTINIPLAIGENAITVTIEGEEKSIQITRIDNTIPPRYPPTNIKVSALDGGARVSWDRLAEADTYNIYYASSPGVTISNYFSLPDGNKVTTPLYQTHQSILGLKNGTVYYFVVTAENSFGESDESLEARPDEPDIPTGISAEGDHFGIKLSWNPINDPASYNVYYASSPGVTKSNYSTLPNGNKLVSVSSPEAITNLTLGVDYYFIVTAANTGGESAESLEVTARPQYLLSFDIKTFRFDWLEVPGATHYRLLENPDGLSGYSQIGNDIPQGTLSYDHYVPLYKRINASYILQSCITATCDDIQVFNITDRHVDAIGYFKASNTDADDGFGPSFSLSGDGNTMAVGARYEDSNATGINGDQVNNLASHSGAVYLFTRSSEIWFQQAYIKASNTDVDDFFGHKVSLSSDGNTLAVSAVSEDSGSTGIDGNQSDNSASNSGAIYLFTRNGSTWTQQAYIKASNTEEDDRFGTSVSLSADGNTLAVGASFEDSGSTGIDGNQSDNSASGSGAVYLFTYNGSTWTQQAYIKASNTDEFDGFGSSISLSRDGNTLAVGATGESSSTTGINSVPDNNLVASGAAYVFSRSGAIWTQQAYIKASNTNYTDYFGSSISISGDGGTLAVGATGENSSAIGINGDQGDNSANQAGAVYLFTRNGATWTQEAYIKASNTDADDNFGSSVSLSENGNSLAMGAGGESGSAVGIGGNQFDNSANTSGAAYFFIRDGSEWSQQAYIKASNTDAADRFGSSVNISGDGNTLAVGAGSEDSNAIGINGDQADNSATSSGSVYLY